MRPGLYRTLTEIDPYTIDGSRRNGDSIGRDEIVCVIGDETTVTVNLNPITSPTLDGRGVVAIASGQPCILMHCWFNGPDSLRGLERIDL